MALGQAEDLVARLHYAGGGANTATFRHGLYRKTEWPLYPVGAAWWIPPTRSAAEATWSDWTRVLALSRLVLDPDVPKNGASFLLARSVRLIERSGEWDCLVTYADEWQGHTGAIYRAAGWEYVGLTKPERVYVIGGRMVARKAGPVTRTHAEMLALGAECVGAFSKHKFRKVIGRREHHARASGRYCRVCGWYHDGPRCKPYREEGRADPGVLPQPPAPGPHPGGAAGDPPRASAAGGAVGGAGAVVTSRPLLTSGFDSLRLRAVLGAGVDGGVVREPLRRERDQWDVPWLVPDGLVGAGDLRPRRHGVGAGEGGVRVLRGVGVRLVPLDLPPVVM